MLLRRLYRIIPKNLLKYNKIRKYTHVVPTIFRSLTFVSLFTSSKSLDNTRNKTDRYWTTQSIHEVLDKADRLYNEENYLDVYETLNRMQYSNNVEIQWRICRTLFKMSTNKSIPKTIRDNMIHEAFELITKTLELDDQHAEVHKWMAILLDAKTALDGTVARVRAAPTVKYHMVRSLEINPDDPPMLYMLGYWCYEMTKLTWLQRQIARLLFYNAPTAAYEEAYQYFLKAEQLRPRFFVGNIYMLGKCCYEMGWYYRARYYLKIAADLPAYTDLDRKHISNAKKLAEKLKEYDVTINTLGFT